MILFSTQNFLPSIGGTQLYVTGLADALAARGHEIAVYCDADNKDAAERIAKARRYPIQRFGGPRPLMRRNKARAVVKRIGQGGVTALIADTWKSLEHLPAEALSGVHVLCLAHGSEFLVSPESAKARLMRDCLAKADIAAANSHFTADLIGPLVRGKTELRILLPGVDPPPSAPRAFTPRDDDAPPRLLTIARLEPRKGVDAVLRALPLAAVEHPRIAYDIVGKGEDRERLKRLAEKTGILSLVHFHGYVSEERKAKLLSGASLFVLPNRREPGSVEGFGIAFVEAAAFGVPSIAGLDGGAADAVLDGKTGIIIDGDDGKAVRQAISRLLTDTALCRRMGEAAHRRFWSEFAWGSAIHRFEAALAVY